MFIVVQIDLETIFSKNNFLVLYVKNYLLILQAN